MGVTVKKCNMIMSGNDCWNSVCFSCCRKADNKLADVTLSGRLFQKYSRQLIWVCILLRVNTHATSLRRIPYIRLKNELFRARLRPTCENFKLCDITTTTAANDTAATMLLLCCCTALGSRPISSWEKSDRRRKDVTAKQLVKYP